MRTMSRYHRYFPLPILLALLSISPVMASEPAVGAARKSVQTVGHRGLIRHAPENTMAAFSACLDLRIGFEVDVRRTKDGHLVCIHDDTVNRTTNGKGNVADFTLAELRELDAGGWFDPAFRGEKVPTIEEIFALLARRREIVVLVAMDFKSEDEAVEADVVRLAIKHQVLDRLLCIGRAITIPAVRQRLRGADSRTAVAAVANTTAELAGAIADRDSNWVYARFVLSDDQVSRIHRAGKRVFVAGPAVMAEERKNWQSLLSAGVDAILTDYPLELEEVRRKATK